MKTFRQDRHLTQAEMAERLGVNRSRYANWEIGRAYPRPREATRFEDMEASELLVVREQRTGFAPLTPTPLAKIKLWGPVGAGVEPNLRDGERDLYVPADFAADDFGGLVCDGDSMLPYLHPGDYLIFKECKDVRLDKLFAVRPPDGGEPLVKKLVYDAGEGEWILRSLNPRYPDKSATHYELMGYLVGLISANSGLKLGPDRRGIDERYIEDNLKSRLNLPEKK